MPLIFINNLYRNSSEAASGQTFAIPEQRFLHPELFHVAIQVKQGYNLYFFFIFYSSDSRRSLQQ